MKNLDVIEELVLKAVQPGETGKKLIEEIFYLNEKLNEEKELPNVLHLIVTELMELSEQNRVRKEEALEKAGVTEWITKDTRG
ncbi:hypothetical protein KHA80_17570 [Anaerobacillus sp. HL2]|nr:hypothetical protein KHA80_17570 [Anaerobacillus sp. HL2]